MLHRHTQPTLRTGILLAGMGFAMLSPLETSANSGGKTGVTANGCTCHSGGTAPTVSFDAPSSVTAGSKVLVRFLITHKGANQSAGGLDVKASAGTLSVVAGDTSTKVANGEITHTSAKAGTGGISTFSFEWTAPSNPGTVTLDAAGNSVNLSGSTSGDMFAKLSHSITVTEACGDADGDGATAASCGGTDCNDSNPAIQPQAAEACNSQDDNCDGQVDEGVQSTFYQDADGDGHGASTVSTSACTAPSGYVSLDDDCNDDAVGINPEAAELCNDVDDDCDSEVDEISDVQAPPAWYTDSDSDTYGTGEPILACDAPAGTVPTSGDCDDTRADVNPGQTELPAQCGDGIDQNCSGGDLGCSVVDVDQDGVSPVDGDCNDQDPNIKPGAVEICGDGVDQDCLSGDLSCDEVDGDSDSFTPAQGDCDDSDPDINPEASEIPYDGIDQDCSDDDLTDVDGDSFDGGSGGSDCNDSDPDINPEAAEDCEGAVDSDCSGSVEACAATATPVAPTSTPADPLEPTATPTAAPTAPVESPTPTEEEEEAGSCACRSSAPSSGPSSAWLLSFLALVPVLRRRRA